MKALRAWVMRLFGAFGSRRAERELSAEIESHLQLHIDDNIRAGMTPAEARRRAVLALGGVDQAKERYRDRRGLPAFESLVRDFRYGVRTLIKSPGFALAGVIILGLGIGVNSAIFTVVNAVVLRPLPFEQMMDRRTGRTRVRLVDVTSDRYMIARRYMLRLRQDDFDDASETAKLASVLGLSIEQFTEQFGYLVAEEPMPRPFYPSEAPPRHSLVP